MRRPRASRRARPSSRAVRPSVSGSSFFMSERIEPCPFPDVRSA
jgi:hypothetical protein